MGLDLAIGKENANDATGEGYEPTDISFSIDEWAAFFFEEMRIRRPPIYEGIDMAQYYRKAKEMFVAALLEYPMLARMEDFYSDANYDSSETLELLVECNSVLPRLTKPLAIEFIEGLVRGCEEAIESNSGVSLAAD